MNLGTFRSRVCGAIGLSGLSEQTLVDGWTYDAVVAFLTKTKCYVKPFAMSLQAGFGDYDLPTSILAFKTLSLKAADGQGGLLTYTSSADVTERRQLIVVGTDPSVYTIEGWNLLRIFPAAGSSLDSLEGLFIPRPLPMTDPAHDPSDPTYGGVPSEFHPVLEEYVKWKAADWDDDTSSKIGLQYKDTWDRALIEARATINTRGGRNLGPARVGA